MKISVLTFVVLALICAAFVWLQLFLSKKESPWPGLVLPAVSFAWSLLALFGAAVYEGGTWKDELFMALSILLPLNIPTFILLAVYAACRGGSRRKKDLDRMNIQDL